jgi:glycine/D-amino acid oxidase-like deaminating enzyme
MHTIDLAFVGNGIISIVSALKIKEKQPSLKVAIIGPVHRPFSASVAAGAMQAVFCEVEETFHQLPRDREIFSMALAARTGWRDLLSRPELRDAITADDTVMYRRKQATLFEEANFEVACSVANEHQCLEDVPTAQLKKIFCGNLKPEDVVAKKFIGEFAIDPKYFFEQAQTLLETMGVVFIDDKVKNIRPASSGIEILLQQGEKLRASRVVVAAGTYSPELMPADLPMVPIYHAVGSAIVLDGAPEGYADLRLVIRTPNRGGAQCGMHIVPRNAGKFYLGAGNYLSDQEPAHRVETIRYLLETCNDELYGKQALYSIKADFLLGSRPKSLDGYPVVGSYQQCPEVFVATGCYRIGLTIAPVIAEEICRWLENQPRSEAFKNCAPDRKLHSYPSLEVAERYYSESRISNLIEHGLLDARNAKAIAEKKSELEVIARNFNADIIKRHNFAPDFVADPDMYSMLMATASR